MTKFAPFTVLMLAAGFAVSGCFAAAPNRNPTPTSCTGTLDDSVVCTVDVCPATGGAFQHIPSDALCAAGQVCGASGCIARDPACPASCDDGVACTQDTCASGTCRHAPNDAFCGISECVPSDPAAGTDGCVVVPDGPDDFECVFADGSNVIGYTVRVCNGDISGVRTLPTTSGDGREVVNAETRLWSLGDRSVSFDSADPRQTAPAGCVDYDLGGLNGVINVQPYVGQWRVDSSGGHTEWNADEMNLVYLALFDGHPATDIGARAYVCQTASGCGASDWVELGDGFFTIGRDTTFGSAHESRYWCGPGVDMRESLCDTVPIRELVHIACDAFNRPAS